MFQALFNSLSGLFSFSRSLDTVSNNVSNMNTPGFRGSDTFFENVNGGRGTSVSGEGLRTTPGDVRQTGNATDLAIDGNGFFILRDADGNLHYTRAGQFRFDDQGFLVDSVTGFQVMAIDDVGNLVEIDLDAYRTLPPVATTEVTLVGNIVPGTPTHVINSVRVYDTNGNMHTLRVTLTDNTAVTPGSYLVTVADETGATVDTGELRFGLDGTPAPGFNSMSIDLNYQGVAQSVTLSMGAPGSFTGATRLAGSSTNMGARVTDGHGVLGVTELSFDDNGVMQLVYSASERREGPQIALANFSNESSLELSGGRLVSGAGTENRTIGRPGDATFGVIAGGSLEMSNVDLTQEFADMIIIQRGYQASSRVMTVSNEMIEQLYNSTRGG
ncbi:MAG: flagellar basal-body rod protein FlgF [Rhizobium sp.]|nr:flagellar basal-body rod protein FlgF [Rhizobium sp.]